MWGPPGAGKTYGISHFVKALLASSLDDRVLLVAPSNIAVDALVVELIGAARSGSVLAALLGTRKITRFGYPRDPRLLEFPQLFGPPELEYLSENIRAERICLRELEQRRTSEVEKAMQRAKLLQLEQRRRALMADHLRSSTVVATTITSLFTGEKPVLGAGPWRNVIVDEASMVNGAILMGLALIPRDRFLVVGDPRQLAPIFEWERREPPSAEVKEWLSEDPFQIAGLLDGTNGQVIENDSRLVRILAQRRSSLQIWSLVQDLYPGVATSSSRQADNLAQLPPLEGHAFVVLDLSRGRVPALPPDEDSLTVGSAYESACIRAGRSWQNPPTAMLAIDVAREMRQEQTNLRVAIITPYRGQARLIRRWLHEEQQVDARLVGVEVGTVHSFQGAEADAVVLDIVDGPPRPSMGALFRKDDGRRLLNVAITRAIGKLVVIAHRQWVHDHAGDEADFLCRLLFGNKALESVHFVSPPPNDQCGPDTESPIEELLLRAIRGHTPKLPVCTPQHRILNERGRIVSRADFRLCE